MQVLLPWLQIVGYDELGEKVSPSETGSDFSQNALIKARAAFSRYKGQVGGVIADDSGLEVKALGGRPGILTARYGEKELGKKLSDHEKMALLLSELSGETERAARFICSLVFLWSQERFSLFQASMAGKVALSIDENPPYGFGYDPLFLLPNGTRLSSLSPGQKSVFSHRGQAARSLTLWLKPALESGLFDA